MIHQQYSRLILGVVILVGVSIPACQQPRREVMPILSSDLAGPLHASDVGRAYETLAFVYRQGKPGSEARVYQSSDWQIPAGVVLDDTNLLIFAEGSGDQPEHFLRTASLIAESKYHPPGDNPNLLIVLVHWSESTNVVDEHLNYDGQLHGSRILQRVCKVHHKRHGTDGFVSVIGFSAGTRVAQLAFGAVLPVGHPGDRHPTLGPVPDYMKTVNNVVYLGSSLNREDPLPYGVVRNRFINFVNPRDTHYGDAAPYYAPAGTSPIYLHVLEANLHLQRPRTGASANGFRFLPTLTDVDQFDALGTTPAASKPFRMINVDVPTKLIPWSVSSTPIFDDEMDAYVNLAPNHYSMVGRGPAGTLDDAVFKQYRDVSFEFVREQVASAAFRGQVYTFDLEAEPDPNVVPALLNPLNLILSTTPKGPQPQQEAQPQPRVEDPHSQQ